jgi:hypothetical protein
MVVAFSTNKSAESAGLHLTKLFSEWLNDMTDDDKRVEVVNVSTSSSKAGWMMIVQYKFIEDK